MSEAMRFKREIKATCGLDAKMLDTAEDGYVLIVERKLVDAASYELLADFAGRNQLNLQLDIGNYIISTNVLHPPSPTRQTY